MKQFRYNLEKYKSQNSKHQCPGCDYKKTLSRYIDIETGEYLNYKVGRCDREGKCGYHYTPKMYFQDNNISNAPTYSFHNIPTQIINEKPSYLNNELIIKHSLECGNNTLYNFMVKTHGRQKSTEAFKAYKIGTLNNKSPKTIFWQIDQVYKIRTGKVFEYDLNTGKRCGTFFLHKYYKIDDFNLKQCLFGLHLVKTTEQIIGIVESEKTALVASMYFKQLTWLATGSKQMLKEDLLLPLKYNKIILFPDAGAYDLWNSKAIELKNKFNITVSNYIETNANQFLKQEDIDLEDILSGKVFLAKPS